MLKTIPQILLLLAALTVQARAEPVAVVASIKPVHSLVAMVTRGVSFPYLLIGNNASPHDYALRVSDARALQEANAVFWIGPGLESALVRPLATLAGKAGIFSLSKIEGLAPLPVAGADRVNMHYWLDPENAALMVQTIADALSEVDPDNAGRYRNNALAAVILLRELTLEVANIVAPVRGRDFIAFHDAYRYFERRFGVPASAVITINPQTAPGVKRISEIKQLIASNNVGCVFFEPQFSARLVNALSDESNVKIGILDPLGAALEPGPGLYFQLLTNMAEAMRDCLQN